MEKGSYKMMNWKQFLEIAWPEDLAIEESHRDIIFLFRSHRWIGLRLAYLFYLLRISANFVSLNRMFMSLVSFYFLSLAIQGNIWLPFMGVLLLYGQNILDYSDGSVARASGKVNLLGKVLDDVVDTFSRGCILVLIGAFTESVFVVTISVFSSFILINFRNDAGTKISDGTMFKAVESFYRIILCPQTMLFILPLLIVLNNILNWQIVIFSYIVVGFYAGLAILWLSLCLWKRA